MPGPRQGRDASTWRPALLAGAVAERLSPYGANKTANPPHALPAKLVVFAGTFRPPGCQQVPAADESVESAPSAARQPPGSASPRTKSSPDRPLRCARRRGHVGAEPGTARPSVPSLVG